MKEINKKLWRRGEWDNEKDEYSFKRQGYPCAILRTSMGHLCGYVGVPPTHPLHGVDCTSSHFDLEVHGGVTWSEPGLTDNLPVDHWFIGFDCAHHNDLSPHLHLRPQPGDIYRNVSYVTKQVTKLAKQLKKLEK